MLILGRKEGEAILIEGGIRIVVVSCDRGGVRLGIEAPADVKILRGEIADRVAEENQRATALRPDSPLVAALVAPLVAPAAASAAEPPAASAPSAPAPRA